MAYVYVVITQNTCAMPTPIKKQKGSLGLKRNLPCVCTISRRLINEQKYMKMQASLFLLEEQVCALKKDQEAL